MEHRKQENNSIERRFLSGSEVRMVGENSRTIRGYAATFGKSYNMGWFDEELSADALRNADMTDVRALDNHMPDRILGRSKAGTVRVGVDQIGIWYEADLPNTSVGNDMLENIRVGNVDQSSWGFRLRNTKETRGDKWELRNGRDYRILTDVEVVFDVSPVTFPANPDTSVAKRSLEECREDEVQDEAAESLVAQQAETQAAESLETELQVALLEHDITLTNLF
jgi:HK97 family phage prohead protease